MNHDDWRLVLQNPVTRVRTYMRIDAEGREIFKDEMSADDANALADRTAEVRAELEPDWRHRLRRSTQNHHTHIATIPMVVVNDLIRQGIWHNPERMQNWLNDVNNAVWRTGGGKVRIRET
jgi:hypothetical protein